MQWHSVSEFFEMGGYAFYVWSSFGACAAAMLLEPWLLRQHARSVMRSLKRQQRANPGAAQ